MQKRFFNIAKLIRVNRERMGISQTDLAHKLGFKNGQFVSNTERALCSLPLSKIDATADIFEIDPMLIVEAMTADFRDSAIQRAGILGVYK